MSHKQKSKRPSASRMPVNNVKKRQAATLKLTRSTPVRKEHTHEWLMEQLDRTKGL